MIWICHQSNQAEPLKVSSFESFRRTCRAKYEAENQTLDGRATTRPLKFGCQNCETGLAIKEGRLGELPANVRLIDMQTATASTQHPAGSALSTQHFRFTVWPGLKPFPVGLKIDGLTIGGLKEYWERPLLRGKSKGVCPCCRRTMYASAAGLCGGCYVPNYRKTGVGLLQALAARMPAPERPAAEAGEKQEAGGQDRERQAAAIEALRPGHSPGPGNMVEAQAAAGKSGTQAGLPAADETQAGRKEAPPASSGFLITKEEAKALREPAPEEAAPGPQPGPPLDLSSWQGLDLERLASLGPSRLLAHWRTPVLRRGKHGVCPNCSRPDLARHRFGLCHSCAVAAVGKTGPELILALNEARSRLKGLGKLSATRPRPIAGVAPGYEPLHAVLTEALDQAQAGKGRERPANGRPFLEQPILQEARNVGLGFLAGQARKKILEATNGAEAHPVRAEADLLGAINYIAAEILAIREGVRR